MHLFSRRVLTAGPQAEVMAFVQDMQRYVSGAVGQDVGVWAAVYGAPLGAMSWTMRVDGIGAARAISDKLLADATYHEKLAAGQAFVAGPAEDNIGRPIHGELGDPPPVGSYASVTTAVMGPGGYTAAVGWSVDMAVHAEKVTNQPVMLLTSSFGTFGAVTWIAVHPDAAAADAAANALESDSSYLEKLDAAGNLFVDGSGHRSLVQRIA